MVAVFFKIVVVVVMVIVATVVEVVVIGCRGYIGPFCEEVY